MTWEIFLGISALVAFVGVFVKASKENTTATTKLSCSIDALAKRFDENQTTNVKRLDNHGKQLDDHEKRIVKCEKSLEKVEEKVNYFHDV